jgi:hypothetical protein
MCAPLPIVYGAATAGHVPQWLGVPAPPVGILAARLDVRLVPVEVDGQTSMTRNGRDGREHCRIYLWTY